MVRYLKAGEGFSYPAEFGFSGSASKATGVPYGKGGAVCRADGGKVNTPPPTTNDGPRGTPMPNWNVASRTQKVRTATGEVVDDNTSFKKVAMQPIAREDFKSGGRVTKKAKGGKVKGYDLGGPVMGTLGQMPQQPMAAPLTQMGARPGAGGQSPLIGAVVDAVMKNKAASGMQQRAKGGRITMKQRKALPKGEFALPGKGAGAGGKGPGSYPVPDANHARSALSRVSANGSPAEKAAVRAKVHSRFPAIGQKKG